MMHLGEHHREREEIRPVIERLTRAPVRAQIAILPFERLPRLSRLLGNRARDAEVAEFTSPSVNRYNVRRGHVAVHDAVGIAVGVGQAVTQASALQSSRAM